MKNKDIQITASLSCIELLRVEESIREIESTNISALHYDVVDGIFNECFVFGDIMLEKIREITKLPIVVHLAVRDVEKYLKPMISCGADYIAIHYESPCNHNEVFAKIRELGASPILAFKSTTPVPKDFIQLVNNVDSILKLTVNPGFAGQKFQEDTLLHIKEMRDLLEKNGLNIPIEADGNINEVTIPKVVAAGATILTGGTSGLFIEGKSVKDCLRRMLHATEMED